MNTKILGSDFYQILDVNHSATREEIENAYRLAFETYKAESLAVYSLLNEEERELILLKVKAAYDVLMDNGLRKKYDDQLGMQTHTADYTVQVQVADPAPQKPAAAQPAPTTVQPPAQAPLPQAEAPRAQQATAAAPKPGEVTQPMPRAVPPPPRQIDENRFSGTDLRSIREERGIDLQVIANMTKISIGTLRFIEDNKYELIPAPIYIRGFIKQISSILQIDPEKAVAAYMKSYNQFMETMKGR